MLSNGQHSRMIDFYHIGALLYEILVGLPPGYSNNKRELYSNIINNEPKLPEHLSEESADFLRRILDKDPNTRLGSRRQFKEVKMHPFFEGVDWQKVKSKGYKSPL